VFANLSLLTFVIFDLTQKPLSCGTSTVWTVQVHWRFGSIRYRHCSYLSTTETLSRHACTKVHGVISQKRRVFLVTATRISNVTGIVLFKI